MLEIDLIIHPKLKDWLSDIVNHDETAGFERFVAKGPINDSGPDVWSMTAISSETLGLIKANSEPKYIEADGLKFLTIQYDLVSELNGKFMDWGDNGPELIDRE